MRVLFREIRPGPGAIRCFRKWDVVYGVVLLASRPTPFTRLLDKQMILWTYSTPGPQQGVGDISDF